MNEPRPDEPLEIGTHRDLRANMRAIAQRLNDNPEVARLSLVNPILALEELNVRLSPEVRQHVMDSLRFPPKLKKKIERLGRELATELRGLDLPARLPLNAAERARLVFDKLGLRPLDADAGDCTRLPGSRTRAYAKKHPLVAKLAEYERAKQGALVFHKRETYEAWRAGRKEHRWIRSVRFLI